jgi:protein-disulfide isomerase
MTNNKSVLLLLLGAVAMVVAVFFALRLTGGLFGGDDVPATAMSKSDVEKIVRNYLLENPEVIFEAVDRMKAKEQDERVAEMGEKAKKYAADLYREADPIVAGNPKGDVTIIEFFDYRCPYCRKGKKAIADLLKQDGNVRLVLKEYPILSAESEMAARAAVASLKQGKYWDFHMALMGAEELGPDAVFSIAKSVGIDVAKLKADMADKNVTKRLDAVQTLGRQIGVDATPTFFIGEKPFTGAMTLEELKAAVAAARKPRAS